jgi:hypothetical protein
MQQGQCRCGAVRFVAQGRPLVTMACHCRGCQRMTGGAYSLSSLYDWSRFEITQGEPVLGGLKEGTRHLFCPSCMSWIFTRPEGMDEYVNIRSTMFDKPEGHRPYIETYAGEALPGAATGAVECFETVPEDDQFGPLIGAYAQWSASLDALQEEVG